MLHVKRLLHHVEKVPPKNWGILQAHYQSLIRQYQDEVSYYKSLWQHGRISLTEYRKKTLPKLKAIKNELEATAKVLRAI
jgi:hypothetical protein